MLPYRSKFEYNCAEVLKNEEVEFEYEPFQLEYYSKVRGGECRECGSREVHKIRWYTPDFYLPNQDIIIECKGKFTSETRSKMLDVIRTWPEEKIYLWFMYDNKLDKRSKVRYSDWAERHGIAHHVGLEELPIWLR